MNAKTAIAMVFVLFALAIFPLSIRCQTHLYADGAYFLATLLTTRAVDAAGQTPARLGHHLLTQAGVVAAARAGVDSPRRLSWLYGAMLNYLPWLAYLLATGLLLAGHRPRAALLTTLLYVLLDALTGAFLISESHLAAALFVLTAARLLTGDPSRPRHFAVLLLLGLCGLACYEFWACFFPACLLLLLTAPPAGGPRARLARGLLAALYLLGTCWNAAAIVRSPVAKNRDSMFGVHLEPVRLQVLVVAIAFLLLLLGLLALPQRRAWSAPLRRRLAACRPPAGISVAWLWAGLAALWGSALLLRTDLAAPERAYLLRSLNLILPMLWVGALWVWRRAPTQFAGTPRWATALLLALLCCGATIRVSQAAAFHAFTRQICGIARSQSGYVTVQSVLPGRQRQGWFWSYPTLSLLLPAIEATPGRAIIYQPQATWQPYGPREQPQARALLDALGVATRPMPLTESP